MKNASVVIALIIGVVLGVVVGRMTTEPADNQDTQRVFDSPTGAKNIRPTPKPTIDRPKLAVADQGEDPTYKVTVGDAQVKGPADALVTIVEWSDFECPYCSRGANTMDEVVKNYGGKVRLAFKHNPLPFHKNAPLAAEAAEAAGAQGKFWEFHDKLFANRTAMQRADLERYAQELGLDMGKFKAALDQNTYAKKVKAHQAEANALGARGTPAFFVNGKYLRGAQPYTAFKKVIDAEFQKAEALVQKGTPASEVYAKVTAGGIATIAPPKPQAQAKKPQPAPQRAEFAKVQVGDAHTFGPADAKVTIVEWSDFECPYCGRVVPTLDEIKKNYGDQVRVAFKHQPLPFHKNAQLAAEAAEAAGAQGKFWEYHDKLFANRAAMQRADLERYAQELGLDVAKFKADLDSKKFEAKVKAHSQEGMKVGARGTPTFFINGRLISGAQPFGNFKSIIDEEIKTADELLAKGTPRGQLYAKILTFNEDKFNQPIRIDVAHSPVKGDPKAPVTVVAFSDFECPYCSRAVPVIDEILKNYPGKAKVVFKHQPLGFHKNAQIAAEASMAAHEQGKFWEYHDRLFQNQKALTRSDLEGYAQELGLDMGKFKAALDSGKFTAQVKADQAVAGRVGANGTPTFFINGQKIVGAQPFANFKQIIDQELSKN